ncbi:hypothetical protein DEAC_c36580 [Desulfosporosinus acididurans]|uniref:SMI1 / KNR4 family protein n=1 Tax=Desulfosporosinus acididurans TaxID=476652 RepID=A0A0J1IIC2_9FIRM|nr:hypothetical protein [Desulfosporosinus acididurans]KLU64456.1 hypothetical protein DEAC_c36580 [Desulfosporosinus acididurans]
MIINEFVHWAKTVNKNNRFDEGISAKDLPNALRKLYSVANPKEVVIPLTDLNSVCFYAYEELQELQEDYAVESGTIFATINSDPIYLKDEAVYALKDEILAPSFEIFLQALMSGELFE